MDFGVLGLEGLVGSGSGAGAPSSVSVPHETVTKGVGSRFGSQERFRSGEDDRGETSKVAKTGSDSSAASKAMPLHHGTPLLRSNSFLSGDTNTRQQEQMLSFSSLKSDVTFLNRSNSLLERSSQVAAFPYYHPTHPAYARTGAASYGSASLSASMHVAFSGVRGPFTPNQWIELEHQALIYKYITANVPVPSNLLISLKKSLYPYGLAYSSAVSYPPNSYQWGSFHLGFAGNTDPEPGRCRRTDGKKWRCSRDAVADQKYCERHINRGRHRSRKPVEGQTGQAASGTTSPKVVPTSSMSASGGASNSLAITQQPFKNLQPGAANPCADALVNRVQDSRSVAMMSSTINPKSNESTFFISKQDMPFEECSQSLFGLVTSDSLLNPSQRGSYLNSKNYGGSFLDFNDQETQDQHCLRQFINDWPKDESSRSVITWPDELKSDLTQLSMSIPIAPSELSSTSSPTPEKLALSPLRLSREFHPTHMGLGVNNDLVEPTQKQPNWIPVSWGTSMGGPLGEVLTNSTNNVGTYKSSASLNLAPEHWDSSPQLGSSPTGVLQKSTFRSLSNSSSGSSAVTDSKKTYGGTNLCDDVLGSTLVSSSSIPSL